MSKKPDSRSQPKSRGPLPTATPTAEPASVPGDKEASEPNNPRPSEYMKARRPHLFADTPVKRIIRLSDREIHSALDNLGHRKQEAVFEEFARRLCQREIAPNIRPQTGPTGGGDSKADASSYPVSTELAQRWYWSVPREPTAQRFAFAFSTHSKWASKIRHDVKELSGTRPRPDKIVCVSSRYARDKTRAALETELLDAYGIEVTILDRSWILSVIKDHNNDDLVSEILLNTPSRQAAPGPSDATALKELAELEERFKEPKNDRSDTLAEDFFYAAKLSRKLEKPRHITEGFFARARALAAEHEGLWRRITYHYAWTAFWWFEDYRLLSTLYGEYESRVLERPNIDDLALLSNLLTLFHGAASRSHLQAEDVALQERHERLGSALRKIVKLRRSSPNAALHAQVLLAMHALAEAETKEDASKALKTVEKCFSRSRGLPWFPAESFIETFTELGDRLSAVPGYTELFETMVTVAEERKGELTAGQMLLRHGRQLLADDRPLDALRDLGRARVKLAKDESRGVAIGAIASCGIAYDALGLTWAARMEYMTALHLITAGAKTVSDIPRIAAFIAMRLTWAEIHLGRLTHALSARQIAAPIISALELVDDYEEELLGQEAHLAALILTSDLETATSLKDTFGVLGEMGMEIAQSALLVALGEVEHLPEVSFPAEQDPDVFFRNLLRKVTPTQIASPAGATATYDIALLGTRIRLTADNQPVCLSIAENLLGMIEAFLATATHRDFTFLSSTIHVRIPQSSSPSEPPSINSREEALTPTIETVVGSQTLIWAEGDGRGGYARWLQALLGNLLAAGGVPSKNARQFLKRMAGDAAFERALAFCPLSIAAKELRLYESSLAALSRANTLAMRRTEPWAGSPTPAPARTAPSERNQRELRVKRGEPKGGIPQVPHRQHKVIDLLDPRDPGSFRGVLFIRSLDSTMPPIMALMYADPADGRRLMQRIHARLGNHDDEELLRVAFIDKLDEQGSYGISLGVDLDAITAKEPNSDGFRLFTAATRICFAKRSPGADNLRLFLDAVADEGAYIVCAANFGPGDPPVLANGTPNIDLAHGVLKRRIVYKDASSIGDDDIDWQVVARFGEESAT